MSDTELKVEDFAAAIIGLRSERERLQASYELADAELKEQMKAIEARLLEECNRLNADSIKTKNGTIMRRLSERFTCADWDNFRQFEDANRDYDFRERRIAQGNMKLYLSEHKNDGLPPGVDVMREYTIVVRKPS
jgi:phospholipase C